MEMLLSILMPLFYCYYAERVVFDNGILGQYVKNKDL